MVIEENTKIALKVKVINFQSVGRFEAFGAAS